MNHTHRYQKTNLARAPGKTYIVYRCTLPDCNHYINPELLVGKRCICNRCGKDFIINSEQARLSKPHCSKCKVGRKTEVKGLDSLLEGIIL